jgi:hypothetical protein
MVSEYFGVILGASKKWRCGVSDFLITEIYMLPQYLSTDSRNQRALCWLGFQWLNKRAELLPAIWCRLVLISEQDHTETPDSRLLLQHLCETCLYLLLLLLDGLQEKSIYRSLRCNIRKVTSAVIVFFFQYIKIGYAKSQKKCV